MDIPSESSKRYQAQSTGGNTNLTSEQNYQSKSILLTLVQLVLPLYFYIPIVQGSALIGTASLSVSGALCFVAFLAPWALLVTTSDRRAFFLSFASIAAIAICIGGVAIDWANIFLIDSIRRSRFDVGAANAESPPYCLPWITIYFFAMALLTTTLTFFPVSLFPYFTPGVVPTTQLILEISCLQIVIYLASAIVLHVRHRFAPQIIQITQLHFLVSEFVPHFVSPGAILLQVPLLVATSVNAVVISAISQICYRREFGFPVGAVASTQSSKQKSLPIFVQVFRGIEIVLALASLSILAIIYNMIHHPGRHSGNGLGAAFVMFYGLGAAGLLASPIFVFEFLFYLIRKEYDSGRSRAENPSPQNENGSWNR